MAGPSYGQHVRSLYIQQSRPVIPRQRSNSLPPGLALMNAEEAGIIFSAAERATARRRKMISVDNSFPVSPPDRQENSPLPTTNTSKPSHQRQITSMRASMDKPLPEPPRDTPDQAMEISDINSTLKRSLPPSLTLPEPVHENLPVSPLSSPKRQVASLSLKSYADGLFNFTQNRLTSTIPQLKVESPNRSSRSLEPQEPVSVVTFPAPPTTHSRPLLQSKFSDWSVTTGANSESRRDSLAHTPIELDPGLISPDTFFGGFEDSPKRKEFDFKRFSDISLASSETYEPPSTLPPPTPPSRAPGLVEKEQTSYFTNFDEYLDRGASHRHWPYQEPSPPENVVIDLSPIEVTDKPETPLGLRERANTAIRLAARSAPLMGTNTTPCATYSSPSTPIQLAEVAVRVPHWFIGAIG